MKKIHKIATIVQCFLVVFALFELGGLIYKHFMLENMQSMMSDISLFSEVPFKDTIQLPLPSRLALLGFDVLGTGLLLMIYVSLMKLMSLYKEGKLFAQQTARRLFFTVKLYLTFALIIPVINTLSILAVTFFNPPGERLISISITSHDAKRLFFALLLLALGYITLEGRKMQETSD